MTTSSPETPPPRAQLSLAHVVSRLAAEVAGPLTQALGRVSSMASSGRIDRQGLVALRTDIDNARRAGLVGQRIARFAAGDASPGIERVAIDDVMRQVLTEIAARPDALHAPGQRLQGSGAPVMGDASLMHTVLHAAATWAAGVAGTPIQWVLTSEAEPAQVRLTGRFGHTAALAADESEDSLDWLLVRYAADVSGVAVARRSSEGQCTVTLRFPHPVHADMGGVSAIHLDGGPGERGRLVGCQILVLARRRDVRQRVREALRSHEVFIDYAPSVAAAKEYCDQGAPHGLIYETAFDGEALAQLQQRLRQQSPDIALIELLADGSGCEMGPNGIRLGGEGLQHSLAPTLIMGMGRH